MGTTDNKDEQVPSLIITSESSSKTDQEIVNGHETQNHLSDRDDAKTFVAYFNDLHTCACVVL